MTNNEAVINHQVGDFLRAWDNHESCEVVEMRGVGPAVEQCMQILAIEMLREAHEKRMRRSGILPPSATFRSALEMTTYLNASDSQKEKAAYHAWMMWTSGPSVHVKAAKKQGKRIILVQRAFPLCPPAEPVETMREWTEDVLREWATLRATIGPGGKGMPPEQVMEALATVSGRMSLVLKGFLEAMEATDDED